jgi:chromosomal replication initiator protein
LSETLWEKCLSCLQDEFPEQQFNTWIRPLQAELVDHKLTLLAPNRFVLDWIKQRFLERIKELVGQYSQAEPPSVYLAIGSRHDSDPITIKSTHYIDSAHAKVAQPVMDVPNYQSNINPNFTFENFVEGKSNQLA